MVLNRRVFGTTPQRVLIAVAFVGLWMAAGWLLHLETTRYLLLGVPLTIAFQVFVRREPLLALWVRDAPSLRIDARWLLMTAALAAFPLYALYRRAPQSDWAGICWLLCAVLGAPAAAYALQNWDRQASRSILPVAVMVLLLSTLLVLNPIATKGWAVLDGLGPAALVFARWSLLYFTISFILEEVTFRGALDAYVYNPEGRGGKRGYGSAILVSVLWGLWHLPIVPAKEALLLVVLRLVILHTLAGVPLSMAWRIGGNLAVPAAAHALLDGVRNATMSGG